MYFWCGVFSSRSLILLAALDFFCSSFPSFISDIDVVSKFTPFVPSFRSTCCSCDVLGRNDPTTWRYAPNGVTDAWKAAVVALKVEHLVWDVEAMRVGLSMGQLDTVKAYLLEQVSRIDEAKVMDYGASHLDFAIAGRLQ